MENFLNIESYYFYAGDFYLYDKAECYEYLGENEKSLEHYTKFLEIGEKCSEYSYKFLRAGEYLELSKEKIRNNLKVIVDPFLENMEEGEKERFKATLVYKNNEEKVNKDFLTDLKWEWSVNAPADCIYKVEKVEGRTDEIDFKLIKGDFLDIIITATCDFEMNVPEKERGQIIETSRRFDVSGDNSVPIMIVNEDGRRIKRIPFVDASNLEGRNLGKGPFSDEKYRMTVEFLKQLPDEITKNEIKVVYLDKDHAIAHTINLKETEINSNIYIGRDNGKNYELEGYIENNGPVVISIRKLKYINRSIKFIVNHIKIDNNIINEKTFELPIWDNIKNSNIVASNLIYPENSCENLKQEENIPKNSKAIIKITDKSLTEESIKIKILMGKDDEFSRDIICYKKYKNVYYSNPFIVTGIDVNYESLNLEKVNYEVVKIDYEKINIDKFKVICKSKQITPEIKKGVYFLDAFEWFHIFVNNIIVETKNIIKEKLNYFITFDNSPTKIEILNESLLKKNSIFIFNGHGAEYLNPVDNKSYFSHLVVSNYTPNWFIDDITLEAKDFMNFDLPSYDLVFLNGCYTGLDSYNEFSKTTFEKVFKAKSFMGWIDSQNIITILEFQKKFFEQCSKIDPRTGERFTVSNAAGEILKDMTEFSEEDIKIIDNEGVILYE